MIHLMLVDELASSRESLAIILDQQPDMTVIAQTGSLTCAHQTIAASAHLLDLVILDVNLPDGPEEELIPAWRAINPDAVTLVLTSADEPERLARAIGAGASAILHKSASIEEVLRAVRQLHAGEPLISPQDVIAALRLVDQERERDRDTENLIERLTEREHDVLQGLAEGLGDRDIAERHHVALATVRTHISHILGKLGAESRLQALVTAVRHGIVSIE